MTTSVAFARPAPLHTPTGRAWLHVRLDAALALELTRCSEPVVVVRNPPPHRDAAWPVIAFRGATLATRIADWFLHESDPPAPAGPAWLPHRYVPAEEVLALATHLRRSGWATRYEDQVDPVTSQPVRTAVHLDHHGHSCSGLASAPTPADAFCLAALAGLHNLNIRGREQSVGILVTRSAVHGDADLLTRQLHLALPLSSEGLSIAQTALATAATATSASLFFLPWNGHHLGEVLPAEEDPTEVSDDALGRIVDALRHRGHCIPARIAVLDPICDVRDVPGCSGDRPTASTRCRYCDCTPARGCPGSCSWVWTDVGALTGVCSSDACVLLWDLDHRLSLG